jgi:hypothetical protein
MESSVIAYICDAAVETTRMVGANAYKVYRLDKQGDVALEHLFPSTTHLPPPPPTPHIKLVCPDRATRQFTATVHAEHSLPPHPLYSTNSLG